MVQELLDVPRSQGFGVLLVVKENVAFYPMNVRLLSAICQSSDSNMLSQKVEKSGGPLGNSVPDVVHRAAFAVSPKIVEASRMMVNHQIQQQDASEHDKSRCN